MLWQCQGQRLSALLEQEESRSATELHSQEGGSALPAKQVCWKYGLSQRCSFLLLFVDSWLSQCRQYSVYMVAIGTEYGNSPQSNSLLISTPGSRYCAGQLLDSSIVDFESWEASDQKDLKVCV